MVKERGRKPRAPESNLGFIDGKTGEPVQHALNDSIVLQSSAGLAWDGAVLEIGRTRRWAVDGLASAGHILAINLADTPIRIEQKTTAGGFKKVLVPPGALWTSPAGTPFSQRNLSNSYWGALEISTAKVRQILGGPIELRFAPDIVDEQLAAVMRSLISEVDSRGASGPLFAEGLLIAAVSRLSRLFGGHGQPAETVSSARMKLVSERIEDGLGERLSVADLARIAGVSTAHFAQEFKRCTGETPHAYLMRRRLERARLMLAAANSIAEVAAACGFADEPHLCRGFKRQFGVTPGVFARTASRPR